MELTLLKKYDGKQPGATILIDRPRLALFLMGQGIAKETDRFVDVNEKIEPLPTKQPEKIETARPPRKPRKK